MTDERQIMEKTIAHLRAEQWRLERELAKKRRKYEKLKASFSELPSSPFWKKIFQKKLKRIMWEKEDRLRKEILELEQKIIELLTQLIQLIQEEIAEL